MKFDFEVISPPSEVCEKSPLKIITVSVDQILVLSIAKILYDPWLAKDTQMLFVARDPRSIMFDRASDRSCLGKCKNVKELCGRMRANQLRMFQFMKFTPKRFK